VDIDGQMDSRCTGDGTPSPIHTISIHGNPVLANKPATNDPSVYLVTPGTIPPQTGSWTTLYFLPGVHTLGTDFQLYSGKSYYIPGDALVYASFNNDKNNDPGNNIHFFGHGTISGSQFYHNTHQPPGVDVVAININTGTGVSGVRVEGITITDPANHSLEVGSWVPDATKTNVVSWVKMFTWRGNGDGGGCGANNDVNNCFERTQDDGLYVNGRSVRENVLWVDVNGCPFRLSSLPNLTSGTLMIYNNDVIYSRSTWWSHTSALTLPESDTSTKGNGVLFSNIVISDLFPDAPAINIHQGTNGGAFSGTRFANMTIATPINSAGSKNQLNADPGASIHDLTFDNLVIGGVLVTPRNWQNYFTTNGNVYNIFFTASGGTPPDALPRRGWVASASLNSGSASNAIDGDMTTRWSTGADQANGQWFQVDMGSAQTFSKILLDAGSSTNDYPRGYQVKVSNDGTNWSSAVASGSGSNAVITVTFATQTARYIRATQTGSASGISWSIQEFYVYPPAVVVLPRTGWVASASGSGGGSAANALDGNITTRWSPGTYQANGEWFQVDLGSAQSFNQIVLDAGRSSGDYPRGYQVNVSNDGLNGGSAVATGSGTSAVTTITFARQTARYIRVTQTGSSSSNYWSIYEFNVYSAIATTYTLTENSPNGTMALNPAWPTYPAGTVATVTAVPNAGYVFNNWGGDLSGSANPATITMSANKNITANFAASSATYTLNVTSSNGTVTFNPPGSTYPVNTVVTVAAVPNSGYMFTGWSGDLSGSANPTTLTMNANKSITANMDYPVLPRTGWVASASSANGSPANAIDGDISTRWSTGADQANGQWFQVDMGSVQTFNRIVMDAGSSTGDYPRGYRVNVSTDGSNWGSAVATGTGSAVTTVTFATQTARYIRVTQTGSVSGLWWSIHELNVYGPAYTLTETSPNGTVTFNPPGPTYLAGTVVTVTAVPDAGYVFNGWGGDLSGSANPTTIAMTTANKSIVANSIATNALTLSGVTMGPGGSLSFSVTNAGGVYRVQSSTNLGNTGGWASISTNTAPLTFTDTNVLGGAPERFYRVVSP